jgi:hypothetical protein
LGSGREIAIEELKDERHGRYLYRVWGALLRLGAKTPVQPVLQMRRATGGQAGWCPHVFGNHQNRKFCREGTIGPEICSKRRYQPDKELNLMFADMIVICSE